MPAKGSIDITIRDKNGKIIPWKKRNREAANLAARKRRAERKLENPELEYKQRRRWFVKSKFGISLELREHLIELQDNKCLICKRYFPTYSPKWAIDHEHTNNYIRGMLCKPCNSALGLFQDNIEIIQNAADYLKITSTIMDEPTTEDFIRSIELLEKQ